MALKRAQLWDFVLAVVLVVVGVLGTAKAGTDFAGSVPERSIDGFGYGMVVIAAGTLAVRRRWPLATLAVVTLLTAVYLVVGYPYGPIFFSLFVAVYTVARHRTIPQAAPAALVALLLMLTHLFSNDAALPGLWGVLPASAWVIVPFSIGLTLRVAREAIERGHAELIRQHVDEERLRMAHEVHDIVGHGLAAIRMQADVALHVLPKKPEQAQFALDAISRTSGEALEELRATLNTMRQPGSGLELTEQPHLARLDELRQRMADAGARIHLEEAGEPRALPPGVDLTCYRIVQESLTNVLRHGDEKTATVRVAYEPEAVDITVSNPIPATGQPPAGDRLGIGGMRKRVTALGGEFSAGPTPDHRFQVWARIPTVGSP
ncbi:MAG: histidine kinase [Acidimicrobiia bacterium]